MYKLSSSTKVLHNGSKTIIGNELNGGWIKISKQSYNILMTGINNNLDKTELLEKLADDEDRNYISNLFMKLYELGVLETKGISYSKNALINIVSFSLTNRCNLNCVHCGVNALPFTDTDHMTTDLVIKSIDKIIKCNPRIINFTGGEPLLRSDFMDILKYTKENYKGIIAVMTNATLINDEIAKELSSLVSQVDISLDGVDEETCSLIRGKGVFSKVINSINLLKAFGLSKISLSLTVVELNKHLKDSFIQLNKELGTEPIFREFAPTGRGQKNKSTLLLNDDKDKFPDIDMTKENIKQYSSYLKIFNCGAGKRSFYIDYDGSIYPCVIVSMNKNYCIGNIEYIDNLYDFFKNIDCINCGYKSFTEILPSNHFWCKECNVNLFCWGCLQELYFMNEYIDQFSDVCKRRKQKLTQLVWGD